MLLMLSNLPVLSDDTEGLIVRARLANEFYHNAADERLARLHGERILELCRRRGSYPSQTDPVIGNPALDR
jgi:hypothetical protein